MKPCKTCGDEFPESDFYASREGQLHPSCKSCMKEKALARYHQICDEVVSQNNEKVFAVIKGGCSTTEAICAASSLTLSVVRFCLKKLMAENKIKAIRGRSKYQYRTLDISFLLADCWKRATRKEPVYAE